MEYTPPPFFKQGPSALARLIGYSLLSLALLVLDARFHMLEKVRYGFALVLYPLQIAARRATAPTSPAISTGSRTCCPRTIVSSARNSRRPRHRCARASLRPRTPSYVR